MGSEHLQVFLNVASTEKPLPACRIRTWRGGVYIKTGAFSWVDELNCKDNCVLSLSQIISIFCINMITKCLTKWSKFRIFIVNTFKISEFLFLFLLLPEKVYSFFDCILFENWPLKVTQLNFFFFPWSFHFLQYSFICSPYCYLCSFVQALPVFAVISNWNSCKSCILLPNVSPSNIWTLSVMLDFFVRPPWSKKGSIGTLRK